jgi:hypothetical protein
MRIKGLQPTTTSRVKSIRFSVLAAGRRSSSVGGQRWSLRLKPRPLDGGNRNLEIATDLARKMLVDLAMSGNRRDFSIGPVYVYRMPAALS